MKTIKNISLGALGLIAAMAMEAQAQTIFTGGPTDFISVSGNWDNGLPCSCAAAEAEKICFNPF